MVPDPDVATPLWLWASQEKVLVLFKPGRENETAHMCKVETISIFETKNHGSAYCVVYKVYMRNSGKVQTEVRVPVR